MGCAVLSLDCLLQHENLHQLEPGPASACAGSLIVAAQLLVTRRAQAWFWACGQHMLAACHRVHFVQVGSFASWANLLHKQQLLYLAPTVASTLALWCTMKFAR